MEATEARRGYARVAAWDEGNLVQAMARLKNPTIALTTGQNGLGSMLASCGGLCAAGVDAGSQNSPAEASG